MEASEDAQYLRSIAQKRWRRNWESKHGARNVKQNPAYRAAISRCVQRARAQLAKNHPKEYATLLAMERTREGLTYIRQPKRSERLPDPQD